MSAKLHVALVHHPVLNRDGSPGTSAITNLDVHDIARSCRTYDVASYFLVHPIELQRALVERIVEHWTFASSAERIPTRKDALSLVRAIPSLEAMYAELGGREAITLWGTSAAMREESLSFAAARDALAASTKDVVLLLGTSWGLTPEVLASCDSILAPIAGSTKWNHLSVRAACAIMLDRIMPHA